MSVPRVASRVFAIVLSTAVMSFSIGLPVNAANLHDSKSSVVGSQISDCSALMAMIDEPDLDMSMIGPLCQLILMNAAKNIDLEDLEDLELILSVIDLFTRCLESEDIDLDEFWDITSGDEGVLSNMTGLDDVALDEIDVSELFPIESACGMLLLALLNLIDNIDDEPENVTTTTTSVIPTTTTTSTTMMPSTTTTTTTTSTTTSTSTTSTTTLLPTTTTSTLNNLEASGSEHMPTTTTQPAQVLGIQLNNPAASQPLASTGTNSVQVLAAGALSMLIGWIIIGMTHLRRKRSSAN